MGKVKKYSPEWWNTRPEGLNRKIIFGNYVASLTAKSRRERKKRLGHY